jgi:hypothetical protein
MDVRGIHFGDGSLMEVALDDVKWPVCVLTMYNFRVSLEIFHSHMCCSQPASYVAHITWLYSERHHRLAGAVVYHIHLMNIKPSAGLFLLNLPPSC